MHGRCSDVLPEPNMHYKKLENAGELPELKTDNKKLENGGEMYEGLPFLLFLGEIAVVVVFCSRKRDELSIISHGVFNCGGEK